MLDGLFHGVAAWMHSGDEPERLEIITGGRYRVDALRRDGETTIANLCEVGHRRRDATKGGKAPRAILSEQDAVRHDANPPRPGRKRRSVRR